MPKVKVKRKSTFVDMTAMTDVAFLLLNFLLLTSNFVKQEAVSVAAPSSVSEIKIPDVNILQIIVDPEGKVFIGMDNQVKRMELLDKIGEKYGIQFDENERKEFSLVNSFGVPVEKLKAFLAIPSSTRGMKENALGIPCDSTNNQFKEWVYFARKVNHDLTIAIKADRLTPYPKIRNVMNSLLDLHENRYHLITNLEAMPKDI
jgi:biopolymer transport protein ExbD